MHPIPALLGGQTLVTLTGTLSRVAPSLPSRPAQTTRGRGEIGGAWAQELPTPSIGYSALCPHGLGAAFCFLICKMEAIPVHRVVQGFSGDTEKEALYKM